MTKYLQSAPEPLVERHRDEKNFKGRDILERLITDPTMNPTWQALKKRVKRPNDWVRLFREIVYIADRARKPPPLRQAMRRRFLDIAKQAGHLAESIAEGPLDRLPYELFSTDVMAMLGATNWSDLDTMQRDDFAHRLLPVWPSVPDLLRELEAQATRLAARAMTEKRIVERKKNKPEALYFVRALVAYFNDEFRSPLYGPVTDIANVGLGFNVTDDFVKKAARGRGT